MVPGEQVPPQPSLGASPHARVEGAEHVGAQQPLARHDWPAGHIVPFGHAGQPAASIGLVLHASVLGFAHAVQHEPPIHVRPDAHIVPSPHVRQTAPAELRWSGISTPHITVFAAGQLGQHEPSIH
jgi:hypothetical protein